MGDLKEGKLIKEIDFQISWCKERIKGYERCIAAAMWRAGMQGPSGYGNGVDYSRQGKTAFSHVGFPDAVAAIEKDRALIRKEQGRIKQLRRRRKNLIMAAEALGGIEQEIFVQRTINKLTQEAAAEVIGISARQLQRVERKMRQEGKMADL